jgi:hypothetical protein
MTASVESLLGCTLLYSYLSLPPCTLPGGNPIFKICNPILAFQHPIFFQRLVVIFRRGPSSPPCNSANLYSQFHLTYFSPSLGALSPLCCIPSLLTIHSPSLLLHLLPILTPQCHRHLTGHPVFMVLNPPQYIMYPPGVMFCTVPSILYPPSHH